MESVVVCSQIVPGFGSSFSVGADRDRERVKGSLSHDEHVETHGSFNGPFRLTDEKAVVTRKKLRSKEKAG